MKIQMYFKRIFREPIEDRYIMLLQDNENKERFLQIYIGEREGQNVAAWSKHIETPRPMTYDIIKSIIGLSDHVKLVKIIIDGCNQQVFSAKMVFDVDGEERIIDSRPSDAIAIGLKMDIPIYAESCVLERHGVVVD